jgi:succinoglycan biosynthesis protein ExoO
LSQEAPQTAESLKPKIRVTVLIPAYKAAATLARAVQSVLNQTEQDLEIIIVDDGSPDNTFEIAQSLADRDLRVRAIRLPENHGKSYAMNCATAQAKGAWIAVLDADDWYAPTRLQRLIDAVENRHVDMVGDNIALVDINANVCVGTVFPAQDEDRLIDLDAFLQASDPTVKADYGMIQPIFRASFIREHSIKYYEPACFGEDYYVLLCFFVAGGKGLLVKQALYYYVQPFGVVSRQWSQEGRKRYNYETLQGVHQHFADAFRDLLSPSQLRLMERRARAIRTMISFHQIRECLAARDFTGALRRAFTAPLRLWVMVMQRLLLRIARTINPCKGPPVSMKTG